MLQVRGQFQIGMVLLEDEGEALVAFKQDFVPLGLGEIDRAQELADDVGRQLKIRRFCLDSEIA